MQGVTYKKNENFIGGTSYPEQFLYRSLQQLFTTTNRYRESVINLEYDIVVPDLNLRIEYSSEYWHLGKEERDQLKKYFCCEKAINFIEILESVGCEKTTVKRNDLHTIIKMKTCSNFVDKQNELNTILKFILKQFGHSLREIDIERAIIEALTACKKYKYTIIRDKEGKIIGTYDNEYFSYNYVNDLEENEEKPIEEVILGEIKKQRLKKQESTVVKEPESSVETEGNKESEDKTLIDQEERKRQRDIAFKKVAKEFWRKNIYEL